MTNATPGTDRHSPLQPSSGFQPEPAFNAAPSSGALADNARLRAPAAAASALRTRHAYAPTWVNVNDLVEEAMALNQPAAKARAVRLHCYSVDPLALWGDRQLLFQAIDYLISRAIKYSARGERVMLEALPAGDDIVIRISGGDAGCGSLDADIALNASTKFSTRPKLGVGAPGVGAPSISDAGLGLRSVTQVAELHQGTMSAQAARGSGGATIALRLPVGQRQSLRRPFRGRT